MPTHAFTIRKLADAAGIGVEAVRYYQKRGLLAQPARVEGGFREYGHEDVRRLRFVKQAQELGFSLDDIAELIALSGEADRRRVRELTRRRAAEIRERITRLSSMADALETLASCCAKTPTGAACPIIAALAGDPPVSTVARSRRPGRRAQAARCATAAGARS